MRVNGGSMDGKLLLWLGCLSFSNGSSGLLKPGNQFEPVYDAMIGRVGLIMVASSGWSFGNTKCVCVCGEGMDVCCGHRVAIDPITSCDFVVQGPSVRMLLYPEQ